MDSRLSIIEKKGGSMTRSSFIENTQRVEEALRWRQVNMIMKAKGKNKSAKDKILLNDVWGEALPNETTALMGPSGAGKTTLLNVLAGRVVSTNRVQVSADIRYGYTNIQSLPGGIQKFRQRIAFVPQEDVVNILSTPREAIHFSAKLRLPQSTSNKEIEALVNEYLEKLGLSKCADVIIGGGLKKGISGGQKKRTCIGIELVTDPGLIFLDEPTSGLDAVSAEDLMGLLNQLARAGNVVIFTIHQPSSSIFLSFDKLILLSEGKLMYHGSTTDVPAYFEKAGYALPELENPADWVLKVAQRYSYEDLKYGGFFFSEDARIFEDSKMNVHRMSYYIPSVDDKTVPMWVQLYWLLRRELITDKRNPWPMYIDLGSHIVMGFITGISYYNIGKTYNPRDVSSVWAVIIAVNTGYSMSLFSQAALRLSTLASQRHLFLKEYFCGTFSVGAYLTCSFIMELMSTMLTELSLCIVTYYLLGLQYGFGWFYLITVLVALNASSSAFLFGSFFSNSEIANAFFMFIVQPQINFTGMWSSIYFIPPFARWLIYILYMRYSTVITLLLLFRDCDKKGILGCTEIFDQVNLDPSREGLYWFGFLAILAITRFFGFIIFSVRAKRFS